MPHNARVLSLNAPALIEEEMRRVGADPTGITHMLPKARHYLVKLENVRLPAIHIVKETFLSKGGEATVCREAVTGKASECSVLLSGTLQQYQRAIATLKEQAFGSKAIASEIETVLARFDSVPNTPPPDSIPNPKLNRLFGAIGSRTLIMGILNVTPDSFSDGGEYTDLESAVGHALQMIEDGADIIDIGGESTRPGSQPVSARQEIDRVVPVIQRLADKTETPISIDTSKSEVAAAALDAGADIINDISAGTFDPQMAFLAAERNCPAVLMHIKGTPRDMQQNPAYDDLMGETYAFLSQRLAAFVEAGCDERVLMIDPGFGFGKTADHNLEILRRLREFKSLGRPILIGTSRKSTIGKLLGDAPVEDRLEGTAATVALSIANGADIVRVHDAEEMTRVAAVSDAVVR